MLILDDTDTYSKKEYYLFHQQAYQSGGANAVTEVTNKYAEKRPRIRLLWHAQKKWMIILLFLHLSRDGFDFIRFIQQLWLAFVNKVQVTEDLDQVFCINKRRCNED